MPSDAMMRKNTSVAMFGAKAHAAVPIAYIIIVSNSVRVRPSRSATRPKTMPPIAQPIRRSEVRMPGPLQRGGARRGSAERNVEQNGHGIRRDVIEEKAVEDIESPSEPGGKQHRPLVCIHIEQRPPGRSATALG